MSAWMTLGPGVSLVSDGPVVSIISVTFIELGKTHIILP